MAKFSTFEDIKAWQTARSLSKEIYRFTKQLKDYRFSSHIQSASVSIMSNIAEGYSRRSNKEFAQFLFIAKASAAEVQSLLYIALDQNYISNECFNDLYKNIDSIARLLSKLISYLLRVWGGGGGGGGGEEGLRLREMRERRLRPQGTVKARKARNGKKDKDWIPVFTGMTVGVDPRPR